MADNSVGIPPVRMSPSCIRRRWSTAIHTAIPPKNSSHARTVRTMSSNAELTGAPLLRVRVERLVGREPSTLLNDQFYSERRMWRLLDVDAHIHPLKTLGLLI